MITWATTQPTPLEVHITMDGIPYTLAMIDPISATNYFYRFLPEMAANAQGLAADAYTDERNKSFLFEGKSIKIEVEITWAVTQPTPLVCRIKYAIKQ